MNSKGIKAVEDEKLCMKCLKNKAIHIYPVSCRGYGSIYDMTDTRFQCCDECDRPEFGEWFFESPTVDDYVENYKYEDNIYELIKNLPLESQELFENRLNTKDYPMEPQDWIDYELGELPKEKCEEYSLYSPEEKTAYREKFSTCEQVVNVVYNDDSKNSRCPFGAFGDYDQKVSINIWEECYDCKYYQKRENPIKTIKNEDFSDWKDYMIMKIRGKELAEKFGV